MSFGQKKWAKARFQIWKWPEKFHIGKLKTLKKGRFWAILAHFRPILAVFEEKIPLVQVSGQKPTFFSYLFKKMYIFYIIIKKANSTCASIPDLELFLTQN